LRREERECIGEEIMVERVQQASSDQWDERLATGVSALDEQHRSLFECVNLLAEATSERSMLRTFYVMEQLSSYVHTHFAEEEFLMRVHGFPGLADHIREHRTFTNRLHQLRRIYLDRDVSVDLVVMLKDWLKNHVTQVDMQYVPYLAAPASADPASEQSPAPARTPANQQMLPCFT
jgi:hemerythrin-like metal-binding protein